MKFDIHIPTRIHFGCGILEKVLRDELNDIRGSLMIISSKSSMHSGALKRVSELLEKLPHVDRVDAFLEVTANPKVEEVNRGISRAMANPPSMIIGLGGGSVLDAAKAIAVGAGVGEPIDRYFFDGAVPSKNTIPTVLIPTTAGTGSELSKGAILSCRERNLKRGLRGESLYARIAIVDPELTYTLPKDKTMETGFDVMAHAVESYVSKASNYLTKALSEQAIEMTARAMIKLSQDLECLQAREELSYASMMMGINLGHASTALPHRMQYPIGAITDTPHARGLMALYPAWIKLTYPYSSKLFDRVGMLITGHACHSCDEALEAFCAWMDSTCGCPSLADLGISKEDVSMLGTMVQGNLGLDPAGNEDGIVKRIYQSAFENSDKGRRGIQCRQL